VYITKMKGFSSELAAAGRVISDVELKEYILAGLGSDYNAIVAAVNANPSTTSADVCNQLMAYDYHQTMLSESEQPSGTFTSSANAAARGRGTRPVHGGGYRHVSYGGGHNNYGGGRNQQRGHPPRRHDTQDGGRRPPPRGVAAVVVATASPRHIKTSNAKFARKTGTPHPSAGGAMVIMMMMMTPTPTTKVRTWLHMVLTQIGTWIQAPQIT
jgi:hypothetical protein